jgi:hypothetical protein
MKGIKGLRSGRVEGEKEPDCYRDTEVERLATIIDS